MIDTTAGKKARASILARAARAGAVLGAYRCICCGGRCDVQVSYDDAGAVARSKGQCRSANCIAWEG
jgi:hypothetical protein